MYKLIVHFNKITFFKILSISWTRGSITWDSGNKFKKS